MNDPCLAVLALLGSVDSQPGEEVWVWHLGGLVGLPLLGRVGTAQCSFLGHAGDGSWAIGVRTFHRGLSVVFTLHEEGREAGVTGAVAVIGDEWGRV